MYSNIFLGEPSASVKHWIIEHYKKPLSPLCFEALEDQGASISLGVKSGCHFQYWKEGDESTKGIEWNGSAVSLAKGEKMYVTAFDENAGAVGDYNKHFSMTGGKVAASGNINSLLKAEGFNEITSLEGRNGCYYHMFSGCYSLTQAPELPATTLADGCYQVMFSSCRSLTQAPKLPATTLANYCYAGMFYDCSELTQAPELPATTLTLAKYCYSSMFQNCTSLTQAPELPAAALANNCYQAMFLDCSSLTQAPELPATTLANECYFNMLDYSTFSALETGFATAADAQAAIERVERPFASEYDPLTLYINCKDGSTFTYEFR